MDPMIRNLEDLEKAYDNLYKVFYEVKNNMSQLGEKPHIIEKKKRLIDDIYILCVEMKGLLNFERKGMFYMDGEGRIKP